MVAAGFGTNFIASLDIAVHSPRFGLYVHEYGRVEPICEAVSLLVFNEG